MFRTNLEKRREIGTENIIKYLSNLVLNITWCVTTGQRLLFLGGLGCFQVPCRVARVTVVRVNVKRSNCETSENDLRVETHATTRDLRPETVN